MAVEETPRFAVGRVISTALSVVFAQIFRFLAIILAIGVPAVLLIVGGVAIFASGSGALSIDVGSATQFLVFILFSLIMLGAYLLIMSAITHGVLQHLRGRPVSIGACLSSGLAATPRLIAASLVLAFAGGLIGLVVGLFSGAFLAAFGLFSFVIGLALGALFLLAITPIWVFIPAIVVERAGALECFGRSMTLTREHRWQIFGILLLLLGANWAVGLVTTALASVAPIAGSVIDIAFALFFLALGSTMSAVGYFYLRAEKEGLGIDDIAAVFD